VLKVISFQFNFCCLILIAAYHSYMFGVLSYPISIAHLRDITLHKCHTWTLGICHSVITSNRVFENFRTYRQTDRVLHYVRNFVG